MTPAGQDPASARVRSPEARAEAGGPVSSRNARLGSGDAVQAPQKVCGPFERRLLLTKHS